MYDGTTATAEAMMLCVAATRSAAACSSRPLSTKPPAAWWPTYARYHGSEPVGSPEHDGVTDRAALTEMLASGNPVAGVIVASPNRHGIL